jgi:hypothetical protein
MIKDSASRIIGICKDLGYEFRASAKARYSMEFVDTSGRAFAIEDQLNTFRVVTASPSWTRFVKNPEPLYLRYSLKDATIRRKILEWYEGFREPYDKSLEVEALRADKLHKAAAAAEKIKKELGWESSLYNAYSIEIRVRESEEAQDFEFSSISLSCSIKPKDLTKIVEILKEFGIE